MAGAFLSYSRQDADVAYRIVQHLRNAGLQVWYDADIQLGDNWAPMIEDQLEQADAVVVIVSPASLQSQWVSNEWSSALTRSVRVIPVLVNGATFSDLPAPLRTVQGIDLNDRADEALERLAAAIGALSTSTAPPASETIDMERLIDDIATRVVDRLGTAAKAGRPGGDDRHEDDLIFVVCSFEPELEPIFESIAAAAKAVGMRAERMKDVPGDYQISERMMAKIRGARLVVVDLSLERPNVYFELGYARGLGKTVVTIMRAGTKVHFDVRDWTYLKYIDSRPLERDLIGRFRFELDRHAA